LPADAEAASRIPAVAGVVRRGPSVPERADRPAARDVLRTTQQTAGADQADRVRKLPARDPGRSWGASGPRCCGLGSRGAPKDDRSWSGTPSGAAEARFAAPWATAPLRVGGPGERRSCAAAPAAERHP